MYQGLSPPERTIGNRILSTAWRTVVLLSWFSYENAWTETLVTAYTDLGRRPTQAVLRFLDHWK